MNKNEYLTNKSSIKINHDFRLDFKDNKFKLIDYVWNGGMDFDYNIFNKEPLPEGECIGSPSSSELTIIVNNTTLYIKHFDIQDGPLGEGQYIGISETKDFNNIEWYKYSYGNGQNSDLIDIIGILSVGLRDEDFIYGYDGLDFYDGFDKVELNIEIDLNKLKNMREDFWG